MKVAVNLMTIADSLLKDGPQQVMKRLHERKISCVELSQHIPLDEGACSGYQEALKMFSMEVCAISARFQGTVSQELKPIKYGDQVLKTHEIEKDRAFLIELCHRFDCHYLRFAGIPGSQLCDWDQLAAYMERLEEMARLYAEEGICLCAHNHMEEFILVKGKTIFDWSLELAPHLFYEIDVRNVQRAGIVPADLIRRCGKRAALLHVQDQRVVASAEGGLWIPGQEKLQGVEIGRGIMDMQGIVKNARQEGCEYLVIEQEASRDPYQSLKISAEALRGMLEAENRRKEGVCPCP